MQSSIHGDRDHQSKESPDCAILGTILCSPRNRHRSPPEAKHWNGWPSLKFQLAVLLWSCCPLSKNSEVRRSIVSVLELHLLAQISTSESVYSTATPDEVHIMERVFLKWSHRGAPTWGVTASRRGASYRGRARRPSSFSEGTNLPMNKGTHVAPRTRGSLRRSAREGSWALFISRFQSGVAVSDPNCRNSMGNTPREVRPWAGDLTNDLNLYINREEATSRARVASAGAAFLVGQFERDYLSQSAPCWLR